MLEYFITDSGCKLLLHTEEYQEKADSLSKNVDVQPLLVTQKLRNCAMNFHLNEAVVSCNFCISNVIYCCIEIYKSRKTRNQRNSAMLGNQGSSPYMIRRNPFRSF